MNKTREINIDASFGKFDSVFSLDEKEANRRNAMLARIIETTDAGVIGMDSDGIIQFWNRGACDIFGYSSFDISGKSITNLIAPEYSDSFLDTMRKIKRGEKIYRLDVRGIKKDGRSIYISVTISQFSVTKIDYKGFSVIVRDITDRIIVEEELRNSREQLRSFAKHIETVREKERKRISIQVHDEFGKALTVLSLDLSWLMKKIPESNLEIREKINSMYEFIDSTAEIVSSITSELRPSVLDHFGLVSAIEWQAEEFKKRSGIKYEIISFPKEIILDEHLSIVIFRVYQEIFTNIIRHARANKVLVKLLKYDDKIILEVRDDGIGIKNEQITNPKSYGIIGIIERIKTLGGEVEIKGIKNQGTTIIVTIPSEYFNYDDD
jgi:PAS domain S-box-containing protein